jgi:type IV pilus assembly protein PilW
MRAPSSRGFTLIELLVAVAVSAIVITGVFVAVNSQQRAYYDGQRQRAAQTAARDALLVLERIVPVAGYGVDAPLALDLDRYAVPADRCPTQMGTCPRDATDNADELVVMRRDPAYWTPAAWDAEPAGHAWRIPQGVAGTTLTASDVTINARIGDRFAAGQIVQAVCKGGGVYAYFTVLANTPGTGTVGAIGTLTIRLEAAAATDPFHQQGWATNGAAMNACFTNGTARLFLIERYRFHVRPVASGAGFVPYLVLDPGKDANFDGLIDTGDEQVLAEGIENFQVAYVMNNPALAPRGLTAGTAVGVTRAAVAAAPQSASGLTTLLFPGTADGNPPLSQSVYAPSSFYPYSVGPPSDPMRLTDHQANVVAVRIAIAARSADPEPDASTGELPSALYNMNTQPGWITPSTKFARVRVEATLPLRNTFVRGMNDF